MTLRTPGTHWDPRPGDRRRPPTVDEVVWIWQFSQSRSRGTMSWWTMVTSESRRSVRSRWRRPIWPHRSPSTNGLGSTCSTAAGEPLQQPPGGRRLSKPACRRRVDAAGGGVGRVIFHVDDVDAMYEQTLTVGLTPSAPPADAPWRERCFHIRDPDGHELSFARPLPEGTGDQSANGSR